MRCVVRAPQACTMLGRATANGTSGLPALGVLADHGGSMVPQIAELSLQSVDD